ncbi:hypothetical protein Tco_0574285 [Tanacetum coccineum]
MDKFIGVFHAIDCKWTQRAIPFIEDVITEDMWKRVEVNCITIMSSCVMLRFYHGRRSTSKKVVDEIKAFYDCKYPSACEAAWRIFSFETHYSTPSVERLLFHLPGEQQVLYNENTGLETVIHKPSVGHNMFEGWLIMNELYPAARELTYFEFPTKYVWNAPKRIWTLRKKGKSIGRIYSVPISTGDAYYYRMLQKSAKGSELLNDDKEYVEGIKDAAYWAPAKHCHTPTRRKHGLTPNSRQYGLGAATPVDALHNSSSHDRMAQKI